MARLSLSKEEDKIICDLYNQGKRIGEIIPIIHRSRTGIYNSLLRNKINIRKSDDEIRRVFFNQGYFHKIDSEKKAYFLGLLCADGAIYNDIGNQAVVISLVEKDRELLDAFAADIGYNKKLYHINRSPPRQNMDRLCLYSKEMAKDVCALGCGPQKSLTLQFPPKEQVPDELVHHFVRGFFDGDGCACISHGYLFYSLVSSHDFCYKVKEIISSAIGEEIGNVTPHHTSEKVSVYRIGGKRAPLKVFEWMYKDASIYLRRKYDKYMGYKRSLIQDVA